MFFSVPRSERVENVNTFNWIFILIFFFVKTVSLIAFSVNLGGSGDDYGRSVLETRDGGFIVTGFTNSFGAGYADVLLSKFNFDGSHSWTTTLGGSDDDYANSIQETSDGGFIVTGFTNSFGAGSYDVFLSKFNFDGSHVWTTTLGGSDDDYGLSVQETSDGGFIVTGYTKSFGAGSKNVLLSKFNFDGSHNWTTTLGGSDNDYGYSVQETSDGDFIVAGFTESFGAESYYVLLSKFNNDGSHNWTTTLGGSFDDYGFSVQETRDGSFIVAGYTLSFGAYSYYVLLSKFNFDGSHNWTTTLGGSDNDYGNSVQETRDGGFIVAGYTSSFGAGSSDVLLSKFNFDGSHNWTTTLGGYGNDVGNSVQETRDGGLIVAGYASSFGAGSSSDVFLFKFDGSDCCMESAYPNVAKWESVSIDNPNVTVNEGIAVNVNNIFPTVQNQHDMNFSYVCFGCFGVESTSEDTCSSHGNCSSIDLCQCEKNYFGEDCEINTCDGIFSNISDDVCSGHGNCISFDACECSIGYFYPETYCEDWECDNILHSESDVCTGRGECISPDNCNCEDGYDIEQFCTTWKCFNVFQDSENVCNGNGECAYLDLCVCYGNFGGEDCSVDYSLVYGLGIGLPLGFILIFTIIVLCIICCYYLVIIGCCCVCLCCCGLIRRLNLQKKRIKHFGKLKDFDLLMKEQELEEDTSIAHLRINKVLFQIEFGEISLTKVLGEGGSSSVVYQATWQNKVVAFKCFKTRNVCDSQRSFDEFEREVEILGSVSHPNIMQFYGCSLKPPRVGILMEFCSNGDLLLYLKKARIDNGETGIKFSERIRICQEIIFPMMYLHSRSIIHRDLKLENVLMDESKTCKLMDFGLSKIVDRMSQVKTKAIGTSFYMAPELINSENYDEKVDVFAFGICVYMILTEDFFPYGENSMNVELKVSVDPHFRPNVSKMSDYVPEEHVEWMSDVMKTCWDHDPMTRLSFSNLSEVFEKRVEERKNHKEEKDDVVSRKWWKENDKETSERRDLIEVEQSSVDWEGEARRLREEIERLKKEKHKEVRKLRKENKRLKRELKE